MVWFLVGIYLSANPLVWSLVTGLCPISISRDAHSSHLVLAGSPRPLDYYNYYGVGAMPEKFADPFPVYSLLLELSFPIFAWLSPVHSSCFYPSN